MNMQNHVCLDLHSVPCILPFWAQVLSPLLLLPLLLFLVLQQATRGKVKTHIERSHNSTCRVQYTYFILFYFNEVTYRKQRHRLNLLTTIHAGLNDPSSPISFRGLFQLSLWGKSDIFIQKTKAHLEPSHNNTCWPKHPLITYKFWGSYFNCLFYWGKSDKLNALEEIQYYYLNQHSCNTCSMSRQHMLVNDPWYFNKLDEKNPQKCKVNTWAYTIHSTHIKFHKPR